MQRNPLKKATIDDVARLASVSIKTVSRVLNHEPKVRPATQQRVLEAMQALDYSPNSSARRLAGRRSYLLGLMYDNPGMSYITNIQNGALEAARQDHYDILIFPSDYTDPNLPSQLTDLFTNLRVDGLLLTPPICDLDSMRDELKRLSAPHVIISPGSGVETKWSVGTNDREICARMVHHLADLGHERIAFVRGNPDHRAVQNRFAGFLDGMQECGLKVQKSLCVQGLNSFDSGYDCGRRLIKRKNPPTAVFCANDDMAAGVMNAAHESGLSIPGELSVAGFDDVPLASQCWPLLTTIRQPMHEIGVVAATLLIDKIRGKTPEGISRILESQLVIRKSTGPVPVTRS